MNDTVKLIQGEYIKKEDALNAIRKSDHYGQKQKIYVCHREVVDSIDDLPTYSFPDREEAEWKTDNRGFTYCNACKFTKLHDEGRSYKFCPSCGKPMITAYERGKDNE